MLVLGLGLGLGLSTLTGWTLQLMAGETGRGVQASGSGIRWIVDVVGVLGTLSDGMGLHRRGLMGSWM